MLKANKGCLKNALFNPSFAEVQQTLVDVMNMKTTLSSLL